MIGILCMDGLDIRLCREVEMSRVLPDDAHLTELTNDLPGPLGHPSDGPQKDRYNMLSPYVWTSIFTGEPRHRVNGWSDRETWEEQTADLFPMWDKFPVMSVNSIMVCKDGFFENPVTPEGFQPVYDNLRRSKKTDGELVHHWNSAVGDDAAPVMAMGLRIPDAAGHHALKRRLPMKPVYQFIKNHLFTTLNWPEYWIIVSDHGFQTDTENGPRDSGSHAARLNHEPPGVFASNFIPSYNGLTDFTKHWHDDVAAALGKQNREALGYQ